MAEAKEKKQTIVIKKITVVAGGGHGGSWKVAFADFMTAMTAFFLVMWLVGQSEDVKKSVSDYFSTPSIIEYNFSNFGAELTLEKLFQDLVNEPLKAFEQFITPADRTPDIMSMGNKKIQMHYLATKIGAFAKNLEINEQEVTFDIPEEYLFAHNSSNPAAKFVDIMEDVRELVEGLEQTDIFINSELPYRDATKATLKRNLAEERLDIIMNKVEQGMLNETLDIFGKVTVEKVGSLEAGRDMRGYMKFRLRKKEDPKLRSAKKTAKNTTSRPARNTEERTPASAEQVDAAASASGATNEPSPTSEAYDEFVDKMTKKAEGRE